MMNKVKFEIKTTQQWLSDTFEDALDQAVSSEPLEASGVKVILRRVGEASMIPERKTIKISLPLSIELTRAAGLFTVEGKGDITLNLTVDFEITDSLQLKTKTKLVSHEWLRKPVLEIGALNIPVETLVNLVLNHHESILTAKVDNELKKISNLKLLLRKGLETIKETLNNQDLKGNTIDVNMSKIAISEPNLDNGMVSVLGYIDPIIRINPYDQSTNEDIDFEWISNNSKSEGENKIEVPVRIPYDLLEQELVEVLKGVDIAGRNFEIDKIKIRGEDTMNIDLEINEPIKAQVFVTGIPSYDELEGVLNITGLDVKVNPANFIYKMTAPLVNKFIESKMNEFFPFKINESLNKTIKENLPERILTPSGEVHVSQNQLKVSTIHFGADSIDANAQIDNLNVVVLLKENKTT